MSQGCHCLSQSKASLKIKYSTISGLNHFWQWWLNVFPSTQRNIHCLPKQTSPHPPRPSLHCSWNVYRCCGSMVMDDLGTMNWRFFPPRRAWALPVSAETFSGESLAFSKRKQRTWWMWCQQMASNWSIWSSYINLRFYDLEQHTGPASTQQVRYSYTNVSNLSTSASTDW